MTLNMERGSAGKDTKAMLSVGNSFKRVEKRQRLKVLGSDFKSPGTVTPVGRAPNNTDLTPDLPDIPICIYLVIEIYEKRNLFGGS